MSVLTRAEGVLIAVTVALAILAVPFVAVAFL